MASVQIMAATEADVPRLNTLINSAYRGESSRRGWTTEADLLEGMRTSETDLRQLLDQPNTTLLCYREADELLGCVYLETKGDTLYLGMLTVSPERQAGGIGKQLLQAAEEHAQALNCHEITMTVLTARHELVAFYERRGYRATGERIPFPSDNPSVGQPKQPLELMVMAKSLQQGS
ncbi:GNAT family N-acetyltransferase [Rudanella paleaurantiibacter]|uniref:GNAT family N-acetyltransferase n=1 Tax=Rudanella paleaurantiibacter TaxID=2614655 RepID=A0A7J5TSB9_9BACT|nr:GNAT family N-acetyltransferase [Rudanella paleaurantiibacter]KAB7726124.1 GNAT family N-acetyltransferase [Rudanella paleaurantiibacter]